MIVLFNSSLFILFFLPVTLAVLFALSARQWDRAATFWLVVASCAFYAWFSVKLLGLLLLMIVFNFFVGRAISRCRQTARSKLLLGFGVTVNLAVLAYFKYANFLIDNTNALFGAHFAAQHILLPIGISFYTFQEIAYLVDCHRGEAEEYNFIDYSLFILFFPQLIAGPIVHHKELIPQIRLRSIHRFCIDNFAPGLMIFVMGMTKKVLLADNLSRVADAAFAASHTGVALPFLHAWTGALAFTFQIYFDFSGYTDMALGIGLMVGLRLPINFDSPYKSTSIIDFWRRWHITLSRFIRDYIYFSFGGGRHGQFRQVLSLMAAMLLGGLWHGAAWTFVLWGGVHGIYLAVNHGWRSWRKRHGHTPETESWIMPWIARGITFTAVVFAWVLFRAQGLPAAWTHIQSMLHIASGPVAAVACPFGARRLYLLLAGLVVFVFFAPNSQQLLHQWRPALTPVTPYKWPFGMPWLQRLGVLTDSGSLRLGGLLGMACAGVLITLLFHQSLRSTHLLQFIYFQF